MGLIMTGLAWAEIVDVGTRRELFVDNLLIDRLTDLTVQSHEPRPAGVAVRYDLPHEDPLACFYTTVLLLCREQGRHRLGEAGTRSRGG
jgi:hypothetical protein